MKRIGFCGVVVVALTVGTGGDAVTAVPSAPRRSTFDTQSQRARPTRLPLLLVENCGQTDSQVVAYARCRGTTVFFTPTAVTYALDAGDGGWATKTDFVGARADVKPQLRDAAPTVVSFFRGPEAAWRKGVRTFREIAYPDLWPGIDLVYSTESGKLKYRFDVHAGADPTAIRLRLRGADDVLVDDAGRLVAHTPLGDLGDEAPVSWQEKDGVRVDVPTSYSKLTKSAADDVSFGFRVGAHDPAQPLVIDPVVFLYSGYLGGNSNDEAIGIAVDSLHAAYVVGHTQSTPVTFPLAVGPFASKPGGEDAFVAKVAPDGMSFVYVGYIGGGGFDVANAVAVDDQGAAYVLGTTYSDQTSGAFPVKVGPDLSFNGGTDDAFVAKVDPSGTSLVWCGYVGGSQNDGTASTDGAGGGGIAVDAAHDVYVTGTTESSQTDGFPVAVGPDLTFNEPTPGAYGDGFVAKIMADGSGLHWCGYLGGDAADFAHGIAVDGTGHAYVCGTTASQQGTFPVIVGPDLTENGANGDYDGFVAKVKPDGTGLDWCGYLGGANRDDCEAIAVTAAGEPYVCGFARSDATSDPGTGGFPVKVGPRLTFGGGNLDGFVARVKSDGTGLQWCGYVGSDTADYCHGIAVGPGGVVFVVGQTSATADAQQNTPPFPAMDGPDLIYHGGVDGFVAEVNASGTGLVYAGYIGGPGVDGAYGVAVDELGAAYVTGSTRGGLTTTAGPDLTFNSSNAFLADAFVVKVSPGSGGGGGGATPIDSFLLPSKVTATFNAKAPAKSKLTISGVFDVGGVNPSITVASTLDVGTIHWDIPKFTQSRNGKSYAYVNPPEPIRPGLAMTITPNAKGSSKWTFALALTGDLTGKIPADGALALKFVSDVAEADGSVTLARGAFQIAKPRGGLLEPCLFIGRASAKLVGAGKDTLSLTLGIATDGTTPAAKSDVTFSFGSFTRTILQSQFTRKGAKDVFTDKRGDITSVVVDYVKQTITIAGKKLTLGTFAQGVNTVDVAAGLGSDLRAVRVQVAVKGAAMSY